MEQITLRDQYKKRAKAYETHDSMMYHKHVGIGGWLILLQARLIGGAALIVIRLISGANCVFPVIVMALTAVCLVEFYRRKASFVAVYVLVAVSSVIMYLTCEPPEWGIAVALLVCEPIIISALFKSDRVRNTFK